MDLDAVWTMWELLEDRKFRIRSLTDEQAQEIGDTLRLPPRETHARRSDIGRWIGAHDGSEWNMGIVRVRLTVARAARGGFSAIYKFERISCNDHRVVVRVFVLQTCRPGSGQEDDIVG